MKILSAITLILSFTLAACGGTGVDGVETKAERVTLPDGSVVICVVSDGFRAGGIDCLDAPR